MGIFVHSIRINEEKYIKYARNQTIFAWVPTKQWQNQNEKKERTLFGPFFEYFNPIANQNAFALSHPPSLSRSDSIRHQQFPMDSQYYCSKQSH